MSVVTLRRMAAVYVLGKSTGERIRESERVTYKVGSKVGI